MNRAFKDGSTKTQWAKQGESTCMASFSTILWPWLTIGAWGRDHQRAEAQDYRAEGDLLRRRFYRKRVGINRGNECATAFRALRRRCSRISGAKVFDSACS